nr:type I secretion system permease/ATPase [Microvirga vignae]
MAALQLDGVPGNRTIDGKKIMKQASKHREESTEVQDALKSCLPSFTSVAGFSAVVNILALTGSIYMLQVYDRVLSSRSIPTLIGLSLIVLAAYALSGGLDMLRGRMLARIGARFDEILAPRVFDLVATMPLKGAKQAESMQPIRDVDTIRGFLSSLGPTALFDMPFMPIFLIGCFMIHPWIGVFSVIGGVCIIFLTIYTDAKSKEPSFQVTKSGAERHALAETSRRNAEAIRALGMLGHLGKRYDEVHVRHVNDGLAASESSAGISAFAKVFRMVLQSGILGLGALLVIEGQMSGGLMIAGSILMSRALAPIEIAVAHWKGFTASRQAYRRLQHIMTLVPAQGKRMPLPAPKAAVSVEEVFVAAPGAQLPIVQAASLRLQAGQGLGLIGPSASGKSTLARALVGVWPAMRGEVRLDGAALDQWEPDALGRHIGYLPQDVELFEGTVAENIARFQPKAKPEDIIAAAKAAGAHELILNLPDGYDTVLGEAGASLSGGQRQRVALARALYGNPFLVVLDEPNASLDGAGDEALNQAILSVRQRGGIVVVITHRPAALGQVDQVAIMEEGRIKAFGPRDEVLQSVMKRNTVPAQTPTIRVQPAPAQASNLREVG